jgi:phage gp36-like protein
MYIQTKDYITRITTSKLSLMIEKDNTVIADADKFACDIIKGYLGRLYMIDDEFAKTGVARNYQLLNWGLNIALYTLYQRTADEDVPEKVIKNFDDTISELADLSKGKTAINLDRVTDAEGESKRMRRMGSRTPRTHDI